MDFVTLSNGVKMPVLGFGVFQIDAKETEQRVLAAIRRWGCGEKIWCCTGGTVYYKQGMD